MHQFCTLGSLAIGKVVFSPASDGTAPLGVIQAEVVRGAEVPGTDVVSLGVMDIATNLDGGYAWLSRERCVPG